MRTAPRLPFLLALLLLAPGLVLAQSLGDAAARERQKRAAAGTRPPARVLSNDDLPKEGGTAPASAQAASSTAPVSQPSRQGDPDQRGQGGEAGEGTPREARLKQAQAAVDAARAGVGAAEERVKELGDKLNPMSPSFIYGSVQTGDAVGEEARTREALKAAEAQLADARDTLVKASQAYENVRLGRDPASPDR
jgi:hypothetical protein